MRKEKRASKKMLNTILKLIKQISFIMIVVYMFYMTAYGWSLNLLTLAPIISFLFVILLAEFSAYL